VSPRRYASETREASSRATRRRIVLGALDLIKAEGGLSNFTMELVAKRSGVSRMTVYYQFHARADLLDALFDELVERGHLVAGIEGALEETDALMVVDRLVDAFCTLWSAEPLAMRRLRSLAAVDPSLEADLRVRDDRRRLAVRMTVDRLAAAGVVETATAQESIEALNALLSFEVWDILGGRDGRVDEARSRVHALVNAAIGSATAR
jgi:AcrR family transcriptional regulator